MARYLCLPTVVFVSALAINVKGGDQPGSVTPAAPKAEANGADSAATQLLADTRDAWARWDSFPGFTADLIVNLDGKESRGGVKVSPTGALDVTLSDSAAQPWADKVLGSIVRHRLDVNFAQRTPCAFTDTDVTHPLGREVSVVGSSTTYRIRDRQIMVVKRQTPHVHFTITVLASHPIVGGKILTDSYVVNTWDGKTGALLSNDAYHQTWQRVGRFDLPRTVTLVSSKAGNKQEVGSLQLVNPRLADSPSGTPAK